MINLKTPCVRCRHAYSFHSKRLHSPCRAMSCHAVAGSACPGFVFADPSPAYTGPLFVEPAAV